MHAIFVLIVGFVFAKSCIVPGWASVVELISAFLFVGFLLWLNPNQKSEVKAESIEALANKIAEIDESLRALRIKIGFAPPDRR